MLTIVSNPDQLRDTNTKKKWGYPSVLKTTGIAPKCAGIGSKFLSQRFFPGASNRRGLNVEIGSPDLYQRLGTTYESAGIGCG